MVQNTYIVMGASPRLNKRSQGSEGTPSLCLQLASGEAGWGVSTLTLDEIYNRQFFVVKIKSH